MVYSLQTRKKFGTTARMNESVVKSQTHPGTARGDEHNLDIVANVDILILRQRQRRFASHIFDEGNFNILFGLTNSLQSEHNIFENDRFPNPAKEGQHELLASVPTVGCF